MTTGYDPNVVKGLLNEMGEAEHNLVMEDERLREAQANFEVASRKYSALRDMTAKYVGQNPYVWILQQGGTIDWEITGRYRFIQMPIGAAVVAALQEMNEPVGLAEIAKKLRSGGVRRSPESLIRAVNAALMRTKGVVKGKDNKYTFVAEEDLPF
jgi:hypothetical protein